MIDYMKDFPLLDAACRKHGYPPRDAEPLPGAEKEALAILRGLMGLDGVLASIAAVGGPAASLAAAVFSTLLT